MDIPMNALGETRLNAPMIDRFEAALTRVAHGALVAGAWLVVAVAALVAADVIGRSLFARPITGTVELARNSVVLIVFCQVPAAILEGKMLRVVALFSRFAHGVRRAIESIAALAAMALFVGLIAADVEPMLRAFQVGEVDGVGELQMPMGPVRAALALLWTLSFLSALVVLIRNLRGAETAPAGILH